MGRQAQMIAVLSSIIVHMDDAMSSESYQYRNNCRRDVGVSNIQVISGLVEEKLSVCMRRMLVNVTLDLTPFVNNVAPPMISGEYSQGPENKHAQDRDLLNSWELE